MIYRIWVFMSFLCSANAFCIEHHIEHPRVAVIGAGIAGLTTAYRLNQAGLNVAVYEARGRVGGRIFTVRMGEHTEELGGENITDGGEAVHIRHLMNELGLELTGGPTSSTHFYFDGDTCIPWQQLMQNIIVDPQSLRKQIDALAATSNNMYEILAGILTEQSPIFQNIAARLAAYEGAPIEQLSTFYTETLFQILLGGISLAHPRNGGDEHVINRLRVQGGNGRLPEKMADTLGCRLHLNMPLMRISKTQEGGFTLLFLNGQVVQADIVVLAIPCSVYEQIAFAEGVIASDRLQAIQRVQYGTNAKILVPFSTAVPKRLAFVNAQGLIVGFFNISGNVLTVYYTGESSRFSPDTIVHRLNQARPAMEKGFGSHCPPFAIPAFADDLAFLAYDGPVGYSWPNDPYARGSYSYIAPGQETLLTAMTQEAGETCKTLFAPIEQKLYFAGEHASILMDVTGTMEAACESGERAARMIQSSFIPPQF